MDFQMAGQVALITGGSRGIGRATAIARRIGMYRSSQAMNMGGQATRFLGIYSGRIHAQADVGMVWKPQVLDQIIR